MKNNGFSDDHLMCLHRKKKINAFFALYNRYRNYGYSIVCNQLKRFKLLNSLGDEKDSIVYEAINETIKNYDKDKGNFKSLFSNITMHITLKCINKFSRDPLSDYISLDDDRKSKDELIFMDSSIETNNQKSKEIESHEIKAIKNSYKGHYQRRIKRMVEMKRDGFTYQEIGARYQMSDKAVRAIFYRLKIRMNKEKNK